MSKVSGATFGELQIDRTFAARLRGFGPVGLLAIILILGGTLITVPLGAVFVLAWVVLSHTPWKDIGYVRPHNWLQTIILGVVLGVSLKFAMKAIVMPLFGAPPINPVYHFIAGNPAAIPPMLLTIIVGAGFGEETVFRGWMFERLGKLFGRARTTVVVTITSILFALAHYMGQGVPGVEQALVSGVVFAIMFAVTGSLVMPIIAHIAFDLTALAIIYWDVESVVAHSIFK